MVLHNSITSITQKTLQKNAYVFFQAVKIKDGFRKKNQLRQFVFYFTVMGPPSHTPT